MLAQLTRTAIPEVRDVDLKGRKVRLVVSSERVDSYGSIIVQDGIDMQKRYAANPVFLWSHPVGDCITPGPERLLGKSIETTRDGSRTLMTFEFLKAGLNPLADMVLGMYEAEVLNACSVGLLDVKEVWARDSDEDIQSLKEEHRLQLLRGEARFVIPTSTLFEVSACFVGAQIDAVAQRDLVDQRMAVRERAFCERANKIMAMAEQQFSRIAAAADKLELLAQTPEERQLAAARTALEAWSG